VGQAVGGGPVAVGGKNLLGADAVVAHRHVYQLGRNLLACEATARVAAQGQQLGGRPKRGFVDVAHDDGERLAVHGGAVVDDTHGVILDAVLQSVHLGNPQHRDELP
jgi:hypothetical protein